MDPEDDDPRDNPDGHGAGDRTQREEATGSQRSGGRGDGTSEKLVKVAETLLDNLDLAASFILDSVQDRIMEPLEATRRVFLLAIVLLLALAAFAIGFPDLFMAIFPYLFGGTALVTAGAIFYLDRQAKELKERIQELSRKARKWKRVASWARSKIT